MNALNQLRAGIRISSRSLLSRLTFPDSDSSASSSTVLDRGGQSTTRQLIFQVQIASRTLVTFSSPDASTQDKGRPACTEEWC